MGSDPGLEVTEISELEETVGSGSTPSLGGALSQGETFSFLCPPPS